MSFRNFNAVWRQMGTDVSHCQTAEEAILFTNLDYNVAKVKMTLKRESIPGIDADYAGIIPAERTVRNNYVTVRTDTGVDLGVVGKNYTIIQNREAFSFFDNLIAQGIGIKYDTAGKTGDGERVFLTALLPDPIKVGGHDLTMKYVFLTNAHERGSSLIAGLSPHRIYCGNQLSAAIQGSPNFIKIRHTASATKKIKQAHELLKLVNNCADQLEQKYNQWAKVRISDHQLRRLIMMAMVPDKEALEHLQKGETDKLPTHFLNTSQRVYEYAMGAPSQQHDTTAGTVYGAYNAVTGYFDNVVEFKNSEAKFKSILIGGNAQLKAQRTFDLCELAATGESFVSMN